MIATTSTEALFRAHLKIPEPTDLPPVNSGELAKRQAAFRAGMKAIIAEARTAFPDNVLDANPNMGTIDFVANSEAAIKQMADHFHAEVLSIGHTSAAA